MSRFGRLRTPEDVFFYRLAAALRMELTIVELGGRFGADAQDDDVAEFLRARARDARRHVTNLEASFRLAGKEPWERPCPPMQGLIRDGEITLRRSGPATHDTAVLTTARSILAYAASSYRALLDLAAGARQHDVIVLLQENLDELDQAGRALDDLARSSALAAGNVSQYAG